MKLTGENCGNFFANSPVSAIGTRYFMINSEIYEIQDVNGYRKHSILPYSPTSSIIHNSKLLLTTEDSLIAWNITREATCEQESHRPIDSQEILLKDIGALRVLDMNETLILSASESQLLVYMVHNKGFVRIDGEYKYIQGRISEYIYSLDTNRDLSILSVLTFQGELTIPSVLCISTGDNTVFLTEDLYIKTFEGYVRILYDLQSLQLGSVEVLSMHSTRPKLYLSFPHTIIILENYIPTVYIPLENPTNTVGFTNLNFLSYSDSKHTMSFYSLLEPFQEDYLSDFEPDEPSLVPVLQDLQVIMTFEPTSTLLNNASQKLTFKPKNTRLKDKPVTFHKKIKSSGYGAPRKPIKKSKNLLAPGMEYQLSGHPSVLQQEHLFPRDSPLHKGSISTVSYSSDGNFLLSTGQDSVIQVLRLPVAKYNRDKLTFVGHESSILKAVWNSDCRYVISSGIDKTLKLWSVTGAKPGECLLSIDSLFTDINFYFVDRFIVASKSNSVSFYKFKLKDPHLRDDIKRLSGKCYYKEVYKLAHPTAQTVTKLSCHNSFHSHLMLLAGSNKAISVFDVDRKAEVRSIQSIHRKNISTLDFYKGSDYMDPLPESYNTFITGAPDNFIQIHDIRAPEGAITLTGHMNSALDIGAQLSPCLRYAASGSEDKSCYVWDIRTGGVLERLRGFKEVTTAVAWSPLHPQLCVSDNEGHIKFFKSS